MLDISTLDLSIVPLITGIVEIIKRAGLNDKFLPLIALILGIAGSFALKLGSAISENIIIGIAFGLMASGFFSQIKTGLGK